jgi:hypothetical protein
MTSNTVLATRDARTVHVRSTKRANERITVALTCYKIPPFLIFKGVTDKHICKRIFSPSFADASEAVYMAQANAWTDEVAMTRYIRNLFVPEVRQLNAAEGNSTNNTHYLLLDSLITHMMGNITQLLELLESAGIEHDHIPGGFTYLR